MKKIVCGSLATLVATVGVALVVVPATASAASGPATSSATAAAIQRAEAQGGTVLEYQASTNTWTQVGPSAPIAGQEATQVSVGQSVAEPEAASTWACVLVLSICNNFGAQYSAVLHGQAKAITSSLDVLDGRELEARIIDTPQDTAIERILDGADAEESSVALATDEDQAILGIGDAVTDEGASVVDVVVDVVLFSWI